MESGCPAQEKSCTTMGYLWVFSEAVTDLLTKGQGKYRNVIIVGAANCGKTFLFNPVTEMHHTFGNPASGSFAWIGVESA